ncbi:MAG: OmpA family protein [Cytophagales bacterium]|nr:OmpA family protein [Cytophagales bacterium]
MKLHISFLLVLLSLHFCFAQKSYSRGEYEVFISKTEKDPKANDAETNFKMGEAYRKSNRIQKSGPYYAQALADGVNEESVYLQYARSLRANQEIEKAKEVLNDFLLKGRDQVLIKQAEREMKNLEKIDDVKNITSFYRVKNLKDINTSSAEYSPAYNDNYLYFTSNRGGGKVYRATGTGYTDLYRVATKGANVNLSTLQQVSPIINDPNINEGSLSLSSDGKWVVFAKGNTGKASGNNNVNLFFSRFRNNTWSEPRPLSVNDLDSWDSTPVLSPDGLTLYFSSNRPGGHGGDDLYVANVDRRGRWVDVRNLGPEINTPGNESFPYVSTDGKLYFSSDGHPGFGNLDLFVATRIGGHISIDNLGKPMNSSADDFGMFQFDITRGFFSSNRKGGKGDDDIYTFVNEDPNLRVVNYYLTGTTITEDDGNKSIILPNTKVRLVDTDDNVVGESFTGEDGTFKFRVYPEENYNLIGEKTDYFTTRKIFSTVGKSVDRSTLKELITNVNFETNVMMDRIVLEKSIVLNNIYYDFDKANIREDAKPVLDSLVLIMNDNPEIFIELGSHTDSRDTEAYNLELSLRRALSAVKYIIQSGVDSDRITAKGYGESIPLVFGAKTEEDHQKNRRTEFKVLQYNPKNRDDALPVNEEESDEYDRFFIDDGTGG